jgi:hypothetical protein
MAISMSDYRCPPAAASEDTKVGWFREIVSQGEQWLKQQRAYPSIDEALDLILSPPTEAIPEDMSRVRVPRAKRQIRELVSIMANLRPTAANKTDNPAYYDHAAVFNKIDKWWWYNAFADRSFREGFQETAVTGTGYIGHSWDPDFHGPGRGDIRTDVWGAREVYLINPPRDHDLQRCYCVITVSRVPIHLVWAKYPLRAAEIAPDHGAKAWTRKGMDYVQSFMTSPLRALSGFQTTQEDRDDIFPTCDVYEATIYDQSINTTGHDVTMGKPGTSWEYTVPSYGSEIATGTFGWEGVPLFRKATVEDARLYPLRRRMIATSRVVLEDDTSPWWHGLVPLTRFRFDDWPWEALGFSLVRDVKAIEEDNNHLMRGITDAATIRLAPPMVADENLVSERLANRWNPRQPRQMYRLNMSMGEPIKPILPTNYADLPAYIPVWVQQMEERQDHIMGVRDLVAMAKARQIPSEGTIEKILEMAGPLAQDMTRNMERGMRDLGEFRRYLNLQFRSVKRSLQILGKAGVPEDVFDWDPATMVPSHVEGEDPAKGPSQFSQVERARRHAANFEYYVVPNSMGRLQQMSQKLLLLQLEKAGFPLDPWSKADLYEIDNFGPPPEGANNIIERWIAWQHILAELQAEGAQAQEAAAQGMGPTGAPPAPRGRPNVNRRAPRLAQKDGGTRSTITTS